VTRGEKVKRRQFMDASWTQGHWQVINVLPLGEDLRHGDSQVFEVKDDAAGKIVAAARNVASTTGRAKEVGWDLAWSSR
jgi:hypothetical protein